MQNNFYKGYQTQIFKEMSLFCYLNDNMISQNTRLHNLMDYKEELHSGFLILFILLQTKVHFILQY